MKRRTAAQTRALLAARAERRRRIVAMLKGGSPGAVVTDAPVITPGADISEIEHANRVISLPDAMPEQGPGKPKPPPRGNHLPD